MGRIFSILLLGVGGYLVLQNRFRIVNSLLSNRYIRTFAVSSLMKLPFVRNQMMKTVFSGGSRG